MTTVLDSDLAHSDLSAGSFSPSVWLMGGPFKTSAAPVLMGEVLVKYQAVGMNAAGKLVAWDPAALAQTGDLYARGLISFTGQPAADETITLSGHAITWKASGATGAQVNIGGSATLSATALMTYINAHPDDVDMTAQQAGTILTVEAVAAGAVGNAVTMAKSNTYPAISGATLAGGADNTNVAAPESTLVGFMAQAVDATAADVTGPMFIAGTFNYSLAAWNGAVATKAAAQAACAGTPLWVETPA